MRTINQIINEAKAGTPVDPAECLYAMLALHSMLIQSRMAIETIASHLSSETNTYIAARSLLGNLDFVRMEKAQWLDSNPQAWLMIYNR